MFTEFFYELRSGGLNVSLNEWLTLIEALDKGLCGANFTNFYYICRAVLVKNETDFDKFDRVFLKFFKDLEVREEIPEEVMKWMEKPVDSDIWDRDKLDKTWEEYGLDKILKMLEDRLKTQKKDHSGGNHWIGQGGTSPFGHNGHSSTGIRVGGKSINKSAIQIAGKRDYKAIRSDKILDDRQFSLAFRRLRQFSSKLDGPKTELDIDETIKQTCNNAGYLNLVFDRPRQNTVKLLLLIDTDGSMTPYSDLCKTLFMAVSKYNHFKDVKVYYFHNCVYDKLYTNEYCVDEYSVDTEWVLHNLNRDYKVIIVGDAAMGPGELLSRGGNLRGDYNEIPGIEWLKRIKNRFNKVVWLNPSDQSNFMWNYYYSDYSLEVISGEFKMFKLTLKGLEDALKELLSQRK